MSRSRLWRCFRLLWLSLENKICYDWQNGLPDVHVYECDPRHRNLLFLYYCMTSSLWSRIRNEITPVGNHFWRSVWKLFECHFRKCLLGCWNWALERVGLWYHAKLIVQTPLRHCCPKPHICRVSSWFVWNTTVAIPAPGKHEVCIAGYFLRRLWTRCVKSMWILVFEFGF